jgi:hypothetical protein
LLSDVQRDANEFRQQVSDVLLERLHHDRPVPGQYGSAQRTECRRRELKDDEEVLTALEDAGIDRERVLGVDPEKVDDALEVTELSDRVVRNYLLRHNRSASRASRFVGLSPPACNSLRTTL